jgi:hypothetical protein
VDAKSQTTELEEPSIFAFFARDNTVDRPTIVDDVNKAVVSPSAKNDAWVDQQLQSEEEFNAYLEQQFLDHSHQYVPSSDLL